MISEGFRALLFLGSSNFLHTTQNQSGFNNIKSIKIPDFDFRKETTNNSVVTSSVSISLEGIRGNREPVQRKRESRESDIVMDEKIASGFFVKIDFQRGEFIFFLEI